MNSGPLIFLGLFVTMACSWVSFIMAPQMQIGNLGQTNTVAVSILGGQTYPVAYSGWAHQGAEVYRANGCAACHTEMVRPRGMGSDLSRGWGARRSVAEDYLFEQPVMLGNVRVGPDLANYGRRAYLKQVLERLYDPQLVAKGTIMPPYKFLFDTRPAGAVPSPNALALPAAEAPPAGMEVVPKPQALALAAYLMSLRQDGFLFVAPPPAPPPTNRFLSNTNLIKK